MKIEQSKVTITFSDGMIIELTSEELEELKSYFKEVVYIPSSTPPPYDPKWPFNPPVITWQDNTK